MKIADIHAHIFPDKLAEKASHSIGDFYGVSIEREANMHCLTAEDRLAGVTQLRDEREAGLQRQHLPGRGRPRPRGLPCLRHDLPGYGRL